MMKTKNYILLCAFALSCLFAFSLSSCSTEDMPRVDDGYGYIIATLSTAQRNVLADNGDDRTLHTVRILVFVGDYIETQKVFKRTEPYWADPFRLRVATGDKHVFVVANETAVMTPQLNAVQTILDLYAVQADELTATLFQFVPNRGLPMTGRSLDSEGNPATVQVTEGGASTTIRLTKMVARLDIEITNGVPENYLEIVEFTLVSNAGRSLLWDRTDNAFLHEIPFFPYSLSGQTIDESRNDDGNVWTFGPFYLYENIGNSLNDRDNATRLEIKARLQLPVQCDCTLVYYYYLTDPFYVIYSVYINEILPNTSQITGDAEEHLFNIHRGHHYTLRGTIWGSENTHITVKMNVEPWNRINEGERPIIPITD